MAYANSDNVNRPSLLQVLGDTDIGLKAMWPLGNVLHLGLFTELWLINGTGAVGLDGSGTSAKFGGVGTIDLRGLESHVPLRFSLNTVYFLDNSSDVLGPTEDGARRARHAHRALRPRRQPRRPVPAPHRWRGPAGRRARAPVHRGVHRLPEQPPGIRLPHEQPQQRPVSGEHHGDSLDAHHRQPLLPVEARLLAARRGRHRDGRNERLHRGAGADPAVDALHRRRLGGGHAGPPAGHQDQDDREARRARGSEGARHRLRPREGQDRPGRGRHRDRPTAITPSSRRWRRARTASSATTCRRAPSASTSRPTGTSPEAATSTCRRTSRPCRSTARSRPCRASARSTGTCATPTPATPHRRRAGGAEGLGRQGAAHHDRPVRRLRSSTA